MKVTFYLGEADYKRVKDLTSIEDFTLHHPQLVWVWSTYFRLKQKGYNVILSDEIPARGIVVISTIDFGLLQKPPKGVLVISTVADSPPRFYTHINVSQNPWQHRNYFNVLQFPVWRHIPHWPQPDIIQRNNTRGGRFENIAFLGHNDQLEPFLVSEEFKQAMQQMDLNFEIRNKQFHDYSSIDAILAIRRFSNDLLIHKPYTKLVNAWIAKVPAIVGKESSFRSIQKSELDFISVGNQQELLQALQTLKGDAALRMKMINNGIERATEFTEEAIVKEWEKLLFHDAPRYFEVWGGKNYLSKQLFYTDLLVSRSLRSIRKKISKKFEK